MYKTYIETKHENRDRLGPSEMGYTGYLLTRPRIFLFWIAVWPFRGKVTVLRLSACEIFIMMKLFYVCVSFRLVSWMGDVW